MRLTYCLIICLMQVIFYSNANEVLPNFVVKVETKSAISIREVDTMHVLVTGSNHDGTPLDGKVTLGLYFEGNSMWNNNRNITYSKNIKTANMVKGKAKFDYSITELDLQFPFHCKYQYIKIQASLEENLTSATIIGYASTTIYANHYNLNRCLTVHTCNHYEAGKEQQVLYQITHINGSYHNDTKSTVELIYYERLHRDIYWSYIIQARGEAKPKTQISKNLTLTFKGHMNETGFVNFKVLVPDLPHYKGYSHYYAKELKYLDEKSIYQRVTTKTLLNKYEK